MGRRELSLGEGATFLQRRSRPSKYKALGLGTIPEVTFMGLLVWVGFLTHGKGTFLSHKRGWRSLGQSEKGRKDHME